MRRTVDVMGMPVTVDVRDPGATPDALDAVFAELTRIDELFSPFKPASAVSRINDGALAVRDAGPLVEEVLSLCRTFEGETGGYFTAWYAGRLEPSGLVKGWAIQRACDILDARGYRHYFVDAAGDCRARGDRDETGAPWRVGIRHPVERDKVARVVLAHDLAVATSGTYEKGAHIVDPHTGKPATDLLSLTVVGPDIIAADVYATAAFAMGPRGLAFVELRSGYEAFAITPGLRTTRTSGFDAYCER